MQQMGMDAPFRAQSDEMKLATVGFYRLTNPNQGRISDDCPRLDRIRNSH